MKRIFTLCGAVCLALSSLAQTDTTGKQTPVYDTIRIDGITIIRKPGTKERQVIHDREYKMRNRRNSDKPANLTTNWWIFDVGFSNYNDNTNYASAAAQAYAPGSNET